MLKNIVFVSDFGYVNGGNAKVTIEDALYASRFYNVFLFVGEEKLDERITNSKINVICTHSEEFLKSKNKYKSFFRFVFDKRVYKELSNLLKNFNKNETLIHVHSWPKVLSPSIFKAINKYKFKVLITCHDYFTICPNGGLFNYQKKRICNCNNRLSCRLTNCDSRSIVFKIARDLRYDRQFRYLKCIEKKDNLNFGIISDSQLPLFNRVFKKADYFMISNPVDLIKGNIVDANNNKRFIFIGRISEEKGINFMLEAFKKMSKYQLDVVGEGPLLPSLKEEYKYENIHFLGWKNKEEIKELLYQSRCLVFPSIWYEGSPLTIPEVMSIGIPCLVSNVCNGKDFIDDNKNGWLFDVFNFEDLKNKIKNIAENDISNISLNAFGAIKKRDNKFKEYDKCLKTLFEEKV